MTALDVIQLLVTIFGFLATGVTIWFKLSASIKSEIDQRDTATQKRIGRLEERLVSTRDDLADFKVEVSRSYTPISKTAHLERQIMETIRAIQAGQDSIMQELGKMNASLKVLEERIGHVENNSKR